MSDIDTAALVRSYEALEKLALTKMDDGERVSWYQQRAISAEEANRQLAADVARSEVIKEFPNVDVEDLSGLKNKDEMKAVATRIHAKVEKAKVAGQLVVEEAVKEALKASDEQIKEMQKVYGKPRTPQAGDVTGAESQRTKEQVALGLGGEGEKKIVYGTMEAVSDAARRAAEPMLEALGFIEKEKR
jgi:hypothetical protein